MLVEFSVANYRSIRERQTLSLMASAGAEHREHNTWAIDGSPTLRGLRSAVLYGANASGKSNVLRALLALQQIVAHSAQSQAGVELPVEPFKLDAATLAAPSTFELIFYAADRVRYQYTCAVSADRVHSESLIAYPQGRPQEWFERKLDADGSTYTWTFGRKFRGEAAERKVWHEFTRPNALFLSTAIQLNNEQLRPVFDWITQRLIVVVHRTRFNAGLSVALMRSDTERESVNAFMRAADVDIERVEMREVDPAAIPSRRPVLGELQVEFSIEGSDGALKALKRVQLMTTHRGADGAEIAFGMEDESEGTQKLFELTGAWLRALALGATVVVDELDRSLHPHITRFLIDAFHGARNHANAQLIFTTHDTTLLDTDLLRRDQVWFVEKDAARSTRLYPLLDFSPRKDEALERGYLKGRYGAIPYLGALRFGPE